MGFPVNKTGPFKTMLDAISGNIVLAGYSIFSGIQFNELFNIDLSLNTANINLTEENFVPFGFIEPKENAYLAVELIAIDDPNDFIDSNGDPLQLLLLGFDGNGDRFLEFYNNGTGLIPSNVAEGVPDIQISVSPSNGGSFTAGSDFRLAIKLKYYELP
jgi:hypothetical protein